MNPAPLLESSLQVQTDDGSAAMHRRRIVHLNTHDVSGGAARAAHRLHVALNGSGHDSRMLVSRRDSMEPEILGYEPDMRLPARLIRAARKLRISRSLEAYAATQRRQYEHFRDDRVEIGGDLLRHVPPSDLVHLHWVANFVDYTRFLPAAAAKAPIVWTLHEMTPLTGGCAFDHGCGRFRERCGKCPQLGSDRDRDLSREVWERKRRVYEGFDPARLHFVAPSRWIAGQARASSLTGAFPLTVIPNGIDTDVFRPWPKRELLRAALDIPEEARVVLFLADNPINLRKGFNLLDQALSCLRSTEEVLLLSLGKGKPDLRSRVSHLHLGNIESESLLARIFSVADVFVIPSLEDNFPNTLLEASACGLPAVGFSVGGIPEMIREGTTGLLAAPGDPLALAQAIQTLLSNHELRTFMSENCRRMAVEELGISTMVKRYEQLYESLLPPGTGS